MTGVVGTRQFLYRLRLFVAKNEIFMAKITNKAFMQLTKYEPSDKINVSEFDLF